MPVPYEPDIVENCSACKLRADRMFCYPPAETLAAYSNKPHVE